MVCMHDSSPAVIRPADELDWHSAGKEIVAATAQIGQPLGALRV